MSLKVKFNLAKQTPGALRFEEVDANLRPVTQNDPNCIVGTLYIRKQAFPDGKYPSSITVDIG